MEAWQNIFANLVDEADQRVETIVDRLQGRLSPDPIQIIPFHGYGTVDTFYIRGRVLEDEGIPAIEENASVWDNLSAMYLRFESDEIPNATVQIRFQDVVVETKTDAEGYFEAELKLPSPLSAQTTTASPSRALAESVWHEVTLNLIDGVPQTLLPEPTTGKILVPPARSQFGIISDLDDTVIQTQAASLLQMARITLLNNAHTRLPFPGVAAFYRALQDGTDDASYNPIFYVSSSPWNLYDLLTDFMEVQEIPVGPLSLRDLGLWNRAAGAQAHHSHKLAQVRRILSTYPHLSFILIGDSGQEDPEIYREVVHQFPGRVKAIYIRDVSLDERDVEVDTIIKDIGANDVEMVRIADSFTAAEHAVDCGFISSSSLAEINKDKRDDMS